MSAAEGYLELGLRLGKHVDGLVDAYYGPPELKEQVDAEEPLEPMQLAADGDALAAGLEDGWLRDQVLGCATYAHVLAGSELSYADEVEGCYGVRPVLTDLSVYEDAHAELDELLPGEGSLLDRREAWKKGHLVDGAIAVAALGDLLPILRERTAALLDLPPGEEVTLEAVDNEPWWAFNYYLGDHRSRVVINVDVPTTGLDLIHLGAHEVYPGHHTEHSVKEHLLLRGRGLVEEGIQLVPTPQAVLSEGIAETGRDIVLDEDGRAAAYEVLAAHGVEISDVELGERIDKALEPLRTVGVDAALQIHDGGVSLDEAQAYVERWNLVTPERAAHAISFVTDPTWRAYAITYSTGRDLCRAYVDGEPARFRTLLTEHVRIGDLLASTL